jgi:EAL domain-containing protein (putative c-di-GMP-specific phosphodiesterase class I)
MYASSILQPLVADPDGRVGQSMDCVLRAARSHLGMDVAFISEFRDDDTRILRHVEADASPFCAGDVIPLGEGYCQRVTDGRLPGLIPDTAQLPAARALVETSVVPIGAHLGVPIRLRDGRLYGALCCFSYKPNIALSERDLGILCTLAELVAQHLDAEMEVARARDTLLHRLEMALAQGQPAMVYQPIFKRGDTWTLCGVECLARFRIEPERGPDQWFAEAWEVGRGVALELAAIRRALAEIAELPGDFYVAVNCSPATVLSGELEAALNGVPATRLLLEITEHAIVKDYAALVQALVGLRARGVKIAIDDAGAGYASLHHILSLHPDVIKLDISLIRDIDTDLTKKAMAHALVDFADHTASLILAEGVETAAELDVLTELGVSRVQGYYLSRPLPLAELAALLQAA